MRLAAARSAGLLIPRSQVRSLPAHRFSRHLQVLPLPRGCHARPCVRLRVRNRPSFVATRCNTVRLAAAYVRGFSIPLNSELRDSGLLNAPEWHGSLIVVILRVAGSELKTHALDVLWMARKAGCSRGLSYAARLRPCARASRAAGVLHRLRGTVTRTVQRAVLPAASAAS